MTEALRHLRRVDPVMAQLIRRAGPYAVKPVRGEGAYEALVQAVAHQQLTGKAARTILGRFYALYGIDCCPEPARLVETPDASLRVLRLLARQGGGPQGHRGPVPRRHHPAAALARAHAGRGDHRTPGRGARRRPLDGGDVPDVHPGPPDVLPVDDYGVRLGYKIAYGKRMLPKPKALAKFGERWAPYRTTASWYLWRAVDFARAERGQAG